MTGFCSGVLFGAVMSFGLIALIGGVVWRNRRHVAGWVARYMMEDALNQGDNEW